MKSLALALLALPAPALAQSAPKVGDTVQILRQVQSMSQSEGSTSTSSNSDALTERVTAVRADGVELEYDLPQGSGGGDWKFPVRVFKPARGPLQLIDRKEMETRVDAWLRQGGMTRAACGHWVMGWNAFRIECDPQAALDAVAAFQVDPGGIREGGPFSMPGARGSAPLVKKGDRQLVAELAVDPEQVRKARADNDLAAAEINQQPLTADAARRAHAGDVISGTITVTFELDDAGQPARRTAVTKVQIKAGGRTETQSLTEVLQRRTAPKPPRDPNMI